MVNSITSICLSEQINTSKDVIVVCSGFNLSIKDVIPFGFMQVFLEKNSSSEWCACEMQIVPHRLY